MWDLMVAENRILERWAELMGCSTYASERLGHNCGVQKIHLKPHSNINMAYQRLRFTYSHSLLVQATCPLYRYGLGYTFARRPLYSSGALWCNVSGNMFSSLHMISSQATYVPFSLQMWLFLYFVKGVAWRSTGCPHLSSSALTALITRIIDMGLNGM